MERDDLESPSLESVESRIAEVPRRRAPLALRQAVLSGVQRELAAAQWDRRLARATMALLALGFGLNASIGITWPRPGARPSDQRAYERSRESLVEAAVHMADVTDAATGRYFARHLAQAAGWAMTDEELRAIDTAIQRRSTQGMPNGG